MINNFFTNVADVAASNYGVAYLTKTLPPLEAIGTNASPKEQKPGSSVRVYFADSASVSSTFNGTYSPANPNLKGVDIPLKHLVQSFGIYEADIMEGEGVSSQYQQIADVFLGQLATDIVNELLNPATASANVGTVLSISASAFNYNNVATASLTAGNANWPSTGRKLILNPSFYGKLVNDSRVVNSYHIASAITDGKAPNVAGFATYEVNSIPGAGTAKTTVGLALRDGGLVPVIRPVQKDSAGSGAGVQSTIVTTDSGYPITVSTWYEPIYGKRIYVFETQVGSVVLDKSRVIQIENAG